ncbi:hypothetical protein Sru01_40170 [Sphaerisporangium rufum]|uniref:Uncharacterized protein n=1 Tax=Sphaerisporangium rufum TaxID=1381558 RepID=A0A919V658_9ACTN|nr:hypothetical protein [Sphaerisporangium rufum]GII79035.1 hypothetical protein Sru01_40170 [Sphaerisporangium rufum]
MSRRTEADLTEVLHRVADSAPEPAGLFAELARRRRRRRARRRTTLAVAAAVAAVAVAAPAAIHAVGDRFTVMVRPDLASGSPPPVPAPRRVDARPAEELWPGAIRTVPATAADGRPYRIMAVLDRTRVLLGVESSLDRMDRLEVYDSASGVRTEFARLSSPGIRRSFTGVVAGERHIAWRSEFTYDRRRRTELWAMPRDGGRQRPVAVLTGKDQDVERLQEAGDHLVWSTRSGGVYRVPLGGGTPERLAGTDGLHLTTWPWAADVATPSLGDENQTLLVDLASGTRRALRPRPGVTGLRCSPDRCLGRAGGRIVIGRPDDPELKPLTEPTLERGVELGQGRFLLVSDLVETAGGERFSGLVYDLATGDVAGVGSVVGTLQTGLTGVAITSPPDGTFAGWRAGPLQSNEICRPAPEGKETNPEDVRGGAAGGMCHVEITGPAKEFRLLDLTAMSPPPPR